MCEKDSVCSCLTDQNETCTCNKRDSDEDMTCPTGEPPSTDNTPVWLHIIVSRAEESLHGNVAKEIQIQPIAPLLPLPGIT